MMLIKILSWNVNSVRLRLSLVHRLIQKTQPDILFLQEVKCAPEAFPQEALRQMGFPHSVIESQKTWHGVAILSRLPLKRSPTLFGKARHAAAEIETPQGALHLHNVYVPAGGDLANANLNPKFAEKLAFLDAMTKFFDTSKNRAAILAGDFNIAPLPCDVWSHTQLLNVVSHTPQEVKKLSRLAATQKWIDATRTQTPPPQKLYSWWSYRAKDWRASDRGRRLDHIWLTPSLREALVESAIDKEVRGWPRPSDHAPVSAVLRL